MVVFLYLFCLFSSTRSSKVGISGLPLLTASALLETVHPAHPSSAFTTLRPPGISPGLLFSSIVHRASPIYYSLTHCSSQPTYCEKTPEHHHKYRPRHFTTADLLTTRPVSYYDLWSYHDSRTLSFWEILAFWFPTVCPSPTKINSFIVYSRFNSFHVTSFNSSSFTHTLSVFFQTAWIHISINIYY